MALGMCGSRGGEGGREWMCFQGACKSPPQTKPGHVVILNGDPRLVPRAEVRDALEKSLGGQFRRLSEDAKYYPSDVVPASAKYKDDVSRVANLGAKAGHMAGGGLVPVVEWHDPFHTYAHGIRSMISPEKSSSGATSALLYHPISKLPVHSPEGRNPFQTLTQYGILLRGVPEKTPQTIDSISRRDLAALLKRSSKGMPEEDARAMSSIVHHFLTPAWGLDQKESVHLEPRVPHDVVLNAQKDSPKVMSKAILQSVEDARTGKRGSSVLFALPSPASPLRPMACPHCSRFLNQRNAMVNPNARFVSEVPVCKACSDHILPVLQLGGSNTATIALGFGTNMDASAPIPTPTQQPSPTPQPPQYQQGAGAPSGAGTAMDPAVQMMMMQQQQQQQQQMQAAAQQTPTPQQGNTPMAPQPQAQPMATRPVAQQPQAAAQPIKPQATLSAPGGYQPTGLTLDQTTEKQAEEPNADPNFPAVLSTRWYEMYSDRTFVQDGSWEILPYSPSADGKLEVQPQIQTYDAIIPALEEGSKFIDPSTIELPYGNVSFVRPFEVHFLKLRAQDVALVPKNSPPSPWSLVTMGGSEGNPAFMMGLSDVALQKAETSVFTRYDERKGLYEVKLFGWDPQLETFSRGMKVVVDERLPVISNDTIPAFSFHDGRSLWPSLLEKAFAKAMGGYKVVRSQMTPAYVTAVLMGGTAWKMTPKAGAQWDYNAAGKDFCDLLSDNHFLHCQFKPSAQSPALKINGRKDFEFGPDGLMANQPHQILKYRKVTIDKQGKIFHLLQVRAPWTFDRLSADVKAGFQNSEENFLARSSWRGAWGDGSPQWDQYVQARSLCDYKPATDGSFWIEIHDFLLHVKSIDVCRPMVTGKGRSKLMMGGVAASAAAALSGLAWLVAL